CWSRPLTPNWLFRGGQLAFRLADMTASDKGSFGPLPLRIRPVPRLINLYVGLLAYGLSIAFMVESHLGNMPWDVFHQGIARVTGLSTGVVLIIVGALVLLLWIPLRQRPGLGTVSNVVVIGLAVDGALFVLPTPSALWLRGVFMVAGVLLCAAAS